MLDAVRKIFFFDSFALSRMAPTRRRYLAAAAGAIALAGCQSGGDESGTPAGDGGGNGGGNGNGNGGGNGNDAAEEGDTMPAVQVSEHPEYGEILVDSEGMALYMFDSDTQGSGESTCTDGCLDAWPALTVEGEATAGDGVAAELTTFERENGDMQVAANGWPLYYFEQDSEPGDVEGQGANDVWWILDPAGEPIRPSGDEGTETTTEGGGGY